MLTAYADFQSSVDRIRDVASHIDSEVATATPVVRMRNETLSCGSVVILSGYFEAYLRDVVKAYILSICALGRPFANLPPKIRATHYGSGSKVLHDVTRGRAKSVTSTQEQILTRLHTVQHSTPYELLWEAFADTQSNPGTKTVEDILVGCDVNKAWTKIAAKSSRKRAVAVLRLELDTFVGMRNECAHTGRPAVVPTTSRLRDFAETLLDIAFGIRVVLENRVSTL